MFIVESESCVVEGEGRGGEAMDLLVRESLHRVTRLKQWRERGSKGRKGRTAAVKTRRQK